MREIRITDNEAGKKLDKFLNQYFSEAGMGFLYKMLRKKNIVLNKKKATGKEVLKADDVISVFFSDETFDKFANNNMDKYGEYKSAFERFGSIPVIYEDSNVLILNKPAGILTQKAENSDLSINEWLIGYLLNKGEYSKEELVSFRPSVCNRLDRNTSGLVICSKSLKGARKMSEIIKDRSLKKFYRTIVTGTLKEDMHIDGYLIKDEKENTVKLFTREVEGSSKIETSFRVLDNFSKEQGLSFTELEVELHTGKTHQIRAHLSSIGHPVAGDTKYGISNYNKFLKEKFGLKYQFLHAERVEFPNMDEEFEVLSGKIISAELPEIYHRIKG